ncbi:hypothetical protein B0H63DRAFT_559823 [Podospora didyma]|uniref:Uncharacterized protein n=1 Tax=Podospora didyma TaxID=330526 RepID=A0AAE0NP62_9PEZI|nr:hypothetical protein B0H63DRAFT_559823 [Podospora didyma]
MRYAKSLSAVVAAAILATSALGQLVHDESGYDLWTRSEDDGDYLYARDEGFGELYSRDDEAGMVYARDEEGLYARDEDDLYARGYEDELYARDYDDELYARAAPKAPKELGAAPAIKNYKETFTKYCKGPIDLKGKGKGKAAKAKPKAKGKKREDNDSLPPQRRAMPTGARMVKMGDYDFGKRTDPILFSDSFGTCAGVIITGTPNAAGVTRGLYHVSMEASWDALKPKWNAFVRDVFRSGMTNMKAHFYIIDTSLASDPDYKDDPDMKAWAAELKTGYDQLKKELETGVVGTGNVKVTTHAFDTRGGAEIQVKPDNTVIIDGRTR